jgi:uncharacterized membrane protein YeaQ/YmgE (transglycosylase-associated protein family)
MAFFLYGIVGLLLGLVWYALNPGRGQINVLGQMFLGATGAISGAFTAGFFDAQKRFFRVDMPALLLVFGGALLSLYAAWWVAQIPQDA